ncbi:MAG: DUF4349 domain-containing protein [Candidatus Moraniibacteriota bacterium]
MNSKTKFPGEKQFKKIEHDLESDLKHLKRKKVILAWLVVVAIVVAMLIAVAKFSHQNSNKATGQVAAVSNRSGTTVTSAGPSGNYNMSARFVAPEDASQQGELALGVENFDQAQQQIITIAKANGGSVYSTQLVYTTGSVKRGNLVLQVPQAQFEKTFAALKAVSSQVYQEATQKIPTRNFGVYPMEAEQSIQVGQVGVLKTDAEAKVGESVEDATATISEQKTEATNPQEQTQPAIMPIYSQPVQDQAYIKINFVEKVKGVAGVAVARQNLDGKIWVAFAVKISLVLVLLILLILLVGKTFKLLRHAKTAKKSVKVQSSTTRQASKIRKRAVRVSKK